MRTAQLIVDSSSHPDEAYRAIAQFEEYPNTSKTSPRSPCARTTRAL